MSGDKKNVLSFLSIILFLSLAFICSCKKTPTIPQIDDASRPLIWLDISEMSFATTVNGGNPPSQTLQIKNAGPDKLDYTIEADVDWVSISPSVGISTGQVNEHKISVNRAGLESKEEELAANLTIKCSSAYNNPQHMAVKLNITNGTPPKIWVETKDFTFNAQEGGPNPSHQNLRIKNDGPGTLNYQLNTDASWIKVNPPSGSAQKNLQVHQVQVDVASLNSGEFHGKISVQDNNAANSPQAIEVTLNINKNKPPIISLSTGNLNFAAIQGGSDPPSKSFTVRNTGGGELKYSVEWDADWLLVGPDKGQSAGGAHQKHTVSVNTGGLSTGSYQGTIFVSDSQASNTPQQISVNLNITNPSSDNSISISCNPSSAQTNTIVNFPISIRGNLNEISVFGLELTFDTNIFQLHSIVDGSLTRSWAAVDGNEVSAGTIKIGGFAGSANPIPKSSTGTIVIVKLKVKSTASSNQQTKVRIQNYIDDIQGMTPSSASTTFTYLK
ncbi:MAG: hypothetical protein JSV17_15020 [Candidatus Aminicenantes bacterium]|nr:MAG: hypothetical protein JSV17_15020 [Candidatus Aminicenantes bacterium]